MAGRILIADKVATNRIILKVKLAAASYDVWQVEDDFALTATARRDRPDLILLDADLPASGGYAACKALKSAPETTTIPVVMLTTDYTRETRLRALRAGAEDILEKPVDEQILLARVRNLLRVNGVEEELRRRQGTAAEFGFHEAPEAFAPRARVLIVDEAPDTEGAWQAALAGVRETELRRVAADGVLEAVARDRWQPEILFVPVRDDPRKQGLTLIAELRSRAETRHAAIIAVVPAGAACGSAALDFGANDVMPSDSLGEEAALRAAVQLERKRKSDRLRNTLETGMRLAVTDPLTGLYNRRYALPHLARIAERAAETGQPFAVMVLDLDRFKRINDTHGHAAGDAVLKEVARRLRANLRGVDLLCRLGGEEFLVVMPETDLGAARAAAERLRRIVGCEPVQTGPTTPPIEVTLSIGLCIGGGGSAAAKVPVETIVDQADRALLGAKSHGRNRVTIGRSAA